MNILHLIPYYYPESTIGGSAYVVDQIVRKLIRLGHKVSVYTTNVYDPSRETSDYNFYKHNGVKIKYFKNLSNSLAYKYNLYTPIKFLLIFPFICQKYDIIHLHEIYTIMHIWTVLWARIYKIPYVISPQGTLTIFQNDHRKFRKIIFNKLFNKFIYQRASKFIVSSNQEMKSCLNIGIPYENIEIIPNGIDTKAISKLNKFKFSKPILKINKKFHILLFMARIHPKKGLNLLIKSIKILKKKNLGIFLIIAGPIVDIQYWNSIIKEVKISNLQNSIKYIGQILDEKKHEVLSLCDIYILPSYQEGLPISALEAGFFGLPLLLSKNCGINDIEKEKAGMYIDLNPNDIADKIYSMVNQKKFKKTFGYNAKKLIKNNYTIDKTILKISKIYQDIIN